MNKKILALTVVLCSTVVFASINHLLPDEPAIVQELDEIETELESLEDPLPGAEAESIFDSEADGSWIPGHEPVSPIPQQPDFFDSTPAFFCGSEISCENYNGIPQCDSRSWHSAVGYDSIEQYIEIHGCIPVYGLEHLDLESPRS
jgi:hypothetical protein